MQILTMQDFEASVGTYFDSFRDPGSWDLYKARFATGRDTGALTALARQLAEIVNSHAGSTLVMHLGTGMVPSAENTYLLEAFRRAFGERRGIREAPAHAFTAEENHACSALISLCLHNFWDFMLLAGSRRALVWGSHEEYFQVHALEASELQHLRSVFSASGLKEVAANVMAQTGQQAIPKPRHAPASAQLVPEPEKQRTKSDPGIQGDDFLEQMRELARNHPDNIAILERLARGLLKSLQGTTEQDQQPRRNALLDELHALARENPSDAVVRESLAQGLAFAFRFVDQNEAQICRLVDDLRDLAEAHPDNPELRSQFAIGLYNGFRLLANPAFLEESRHLAARYPEDSATQELLAVNLNCALYFAFQEQRNADALALLDELRQLAKNFPQRAEIREQLAGSLTTALSYAAGDPQPSRNALLQELKLLTHRYPEHQRLAEYLANAQALVQDAGWAAGNGAAV